MTTFFQISVPVKKKLNTAKPDFHPLPENGHCGIKTKTGHIVGGQNAAKGEFPFMAAIGMVICYRLFDQYHYILDASFHS